MSTKVQIIKFATGLEIIAKVVNSTPTELVVDSPLILQAVRSGASAEAINIGLVPFSWGGIPTNVALSKHHILCVLDAESQLETQYLAGLAGLSVPTAGSSVERPKLTLVE